MNTYPKQSEKNNISIFSKCANCGACYNVCPTKAISVQEEGLFYEVVVDEEKCMNCGKCISVCPVNTYQSAQNISAGYSAEHKEKETIAVSSSGGAFSAFAEYIIEQGGVVWGAEFDENYDKVIFQSTRNVSLDNLRRSKYVESSVGQAFNEIEKIVDEGVPVLFCGTPCQVAGLKRVIGEKDNLYTLDFSCGGLASHRLYKEWLSKLKEKYKSEIFDVNFRSKYFGWGTHCVSVRLQNNKKYLKPAVLDSYFSAFLNGKLSVREYCYECQFSDNHYADVIIADYWKYRDTYKSKNFLGISLILVNSNKGKCLLEKVADRMHVKQIPLAQATYNIKETKRNKEYYKKRDAFLRKAKKDGLNCAAKAYCLQGRANSIVYLLKLYLKKIIQRRK